MNRSPAKLSQKTPRKRSPGAGSLLSDKELIRAYTLIKRSRLLDEKAITLYKQNKCNFQVGVSGHEAIQVAAGTVFRAGTDWFYPYYRDLALVVALGETDQEICLSFMNRVDDPNSHGRQMPMHYSHIDLQIVSQSSPTGTQFLQAVGCALGAVKTGKKEVVYVSSGEGTCAQGDFHEALNWAARDRLPVVFVIQNNDYAISVHVSEQLAGKSVFKLTRGYQNLGRFEVDGSNFSESYQVMKQAHQRALAGTGPSIVEAHVPRLLSHSISDNHLKYRTEEEVAQEWKRCPVKLLRSLLLEKKLISEPDLLKIEEELKREIDAASDWAEQQPLPDPDTALDHTFVIDEPWHDITEQEAPQGEPVFMVDALNRALAEELAHNPQMLIYGEDVAKGKGGVFTVTSGLTDKFGEDRVFNSQLAESSIVGVGIGLATRGMKPVVEIQFGDYIWTAMMQIRNELAMLNYRSAGDWTCPVVIRAAVGGYIRGSLYHSQNIDGFFTHIPGLYVIYPSNATDAKALLKASIRASDPVLFLEHKGLYRQPHAKGPEGNSDYLVPIGKAKIVKNGTDLCIITWGALVAKSLWAANELAKSGYSVEVIDLRTLVPLDVDLILSRVRAIGRVLIAHEDLQFMGFGAEIAALISSEVFTYLDAPVKRLGMRYAAGVPFSPGLEARVLPQNEDVLTAAQEVLEF
jgi:2-oxoisovalerate dehydrogenase E1 component